MFQYVHNLLNAVCQMSTTSLSMVVYFKGFFPCIVHSHWRMRFSISGDWSKNEFFCSRNAWNGIFCFLKFCHNRKKKPSGVALQLLNPVATIFSPGLRIHGTYMVGMINGPFGLCVILHTLLIEYVHLCSWKTQTSPWDLICGRSKQIL